jgi:four helix bundle protein
MKPYHGLIAWQRANEFTLEVYRMTKAFPKEELYGITSQLRRASVSVPTNLVEGYARRGKKEWRRYITIADASLTECEYLMELSLALGYLQQEDYNSLEAIRAKTSFLLGKLRQSLVC